MIKCRLFVFSQKQNYFLIVDKLLPLSNMASSMSEENINLKHFQHKMVSQFTCEEVRSDGSMPFLDILITPEEDGSLSASVFRKPTHTDLYLQWDSHHTISSKYSVPGSLYHRAKTVCSNSQLLQKEEDHLCKALKKCKYPIYGKTEKPEPSQKCNRNNNNQTGKNNNNNKNLYIWWSHINKS